MRPIKLKNGQLSKKAINLGLTQLEVIKLSCGHERSVALFRKGSYYRIQSFRYTPCSSVCLVRAKFFVNEYNDARNLYNELVKQYKRLNKVKRG